MQRNNRGHDDGVEILKGGLCQQRGGNAQVWMVAVVLVVGERLLCHIAGCVVTGDGVLRGALVMCGVMVRQAVAHLGPQQWHAQQTREQSG